MDAWSRGALRALLLLVVLLCAPGLAAAREPEIQVSVLTMGPGDPTFSKFGHNAIVIKGRRTRRALVYNFGTFTFKSPNLVSDFLNRRLNYWLSVDSLDDTLRSYRAQNRTVIEQELELTDEQSRAIAAALAENALPENRLYRYDYYLDNCSTRVRDAIDKVVGGLVQKSARPVADQNFREHSLRLAGDDPLLYVGLDFGLSGYVDRPQSEWDESFLPERFAGLLRHVKVPNADGAPLPLVRKERVLFEATREAPPERPPARLLPMLGIGLSLGLGLMALAAQQTRRLARWAYALALGSFGIIAGGAGGLLAFFWLATAHEAAWANLNLLLAPPWLLALVPAAVGVVRGSSWGTRLLRRLIVATIATSLLALLLMATTLAAQDSLRIAALLLPLWVGVAAGEVLAVRRAGAERPLWALVSP
jgi:hypothetical protein